MHVAVGAHRFRKSHVGRLLKQGVVEQVTDVDEHRSHHHRLPDEDDQRAEQHVFPELGAEGKGDVSDHRRGHTADLQAAQPAPPVSPDGSDDLSNTASTLRRCQQRATAVSAPTAITSQTPWDQTIERMERRRTKKNATRCAALAAPDMYGSRCQESPPKQPSQRNTSRPTV